MGRFQKAPKKRNREVYRNKESNLQGKAAVCSDFCCPEDKEGLRECL